jgi:hypothetical protein
VFEFGDQPGLIVLISGTASYWGPHGQTYIPGGARGFVAVETSCDGFYRIRYFRLWMKVSIGTVGRVMILTLPREPSSAEMRAIAALSGASTILTKS